MLKSNQGFTLIEMLMILAIVGLVAATAAVKWPGSLMNTFSLQAQTDQLTRDIQYAQSLAMSRAITGERYTITFDSTNSAYTIAKYGGGSLKSVSLGSGISFTSNNFSGGYLAFDGLGRPYNGTSLMASFLSIGLTKGGTTKTIKVWGNTGAVEVI